jgi:glycerol-3-phosphate dehydrogenase
VHSLAARLGVEMPITAAMNGVLAGALAPQDAVAGLMLRSLKEEGT